MMRLLPTLYRLVTGRPYYTVRSAAAEFGPTPAARYPELLDYPDIELIRRDRAELIAEIRARREALARNREVTRR